jgi:uncharacterized integral membrane protein
MGMVQGDFTMRTSAKLGRANGFTLSRAWTRALLPLALGLGCSLAGCVAADRFRLVEPVTPPASSLNIVAGTPPLELTLGNVITTGAPGSWKLKALWDEYVVRLTNRGDKAISVLSVQLIDARGLTCAAYEDPWKLEELSYAAWDQYGRSAFRAAGWTLEGLALTTAVAVSNSSGIKPGAPSALGKVAIVAGVVGLVDLVVVAVVDSHNKDKVETEFQRHRVHLPLAIGPQESVKGSFFFPVTPTPKALVLGANREGQALEVTADLAPVTIFRQKPEN